MTRMLLLKPCRPLLKDAISDSRISNAYSSWARFTDPPRADIANILDRRALK